MKIRRLEIQGFKSFADRTCFEFGDGISSIVGPNGCGKSNIVDAIKWVLGDMSPRSLRGKRMEDVIFAGSRHRRPVGLAEVTLVLENGTGLLKTDRHEVAITRRLHRSGESEYLLCGDRARLKDIRELFFDTGLGVDGNAIMEQGQIDALLAANPQDRRSIFEEAAGVSRYKQRRKEAEQRLRRTEENLERLLDVLELEEKRLRSLKNQAGRARRYQEVRTQLGRKRVLRAIVRYRTVGKERADLQEALSGVLAREREAAEEFASIETRSRETQAACLAARDAVHAEEARIAEAAADVRAARERAEFLGHSRDDLRTGIETARRDAEKARERGRDLERERSALLQEVKGTEARTEGHLDRLEEAEARLHRFEGEVTRIRDVHEGTKRELLVILGRISEARNEAGGHRVRVRQIEERIARLTRQRVDLETRRQRIETELDEILTRAERLESEVRGGTEDLETCERQRGVLRDRAQAARAKRDAASEERATKAARLDVLGRLAAAGEGLAEGARTVLDAVQGVDPGEDGSRDGILGVLADLVRTAPEQAALLDRLLGPAAGALVTRSADQALRWIDWLRTHHENAKARFLCLDLVRADAPALGNVVGPLGCGPELEALVASVVSGTVLVENLEEGVGHWRRTGTNAVTPAGDRVTASGALLGGADGRILGLVERSAEMRSLGDDVTRLDGVLEDCRREVWGIEAALERTEREIEALRSVLAERAEARSRGSEALSRVQRERGHVLQGLDVLRAEFDALAEDLVFAHEAAAIAGRRVAGHDADRIALEERAEDASRAYVAAEGARHAATERRLEAHLALAEARARHKAACDREGHTVEEMGELERRARVRDEEVGSLEARVASVEVGIAEAEALARRREDERRTGGDALLAARKRLESLEREGESAEVRRREVHDLHEELRGRLEDFRLKDSELRVRIESLVEQVLQDHDLDLAAMENETEATEDIDVHAVEEEVEDLRRRLENLGNVNLNAIVELEEVQERVDFLQTQQKDLLDAKADLHKVIEELDEVSTKRFGETFEAVRKHFRDTFRRLFGGGRADIVLEDASNLLDSGIDIVARPPGKEQRTISLLSGGERTLTAVALLFAVFKAKPSPFAILDEVDAALDEANVRRLIQLIREFTEHSQFLMVTHAKTTMEAADLLYGVTMEEPGVSKKVAVQLTNYPQEVALTAG